MKVERGQGKGKEMPKDDDPWLSPGMDKSVPAFSGGSTVGTSTMNLDEIRKSNAHLELALYTRVSKGQRPRLWILIGMRKGVEFQHCMSHSLYITQDLIKDCLPVHPESCILVIMSCLDSHLSSKTPKLGVCVRLILITTTLEN
jgi:hypothetical protein